MKRSYLLMTSAFFLIGFACGGCQMAAPGTYPNSQSSNPYANPYGQRSPGPLTPNGSANFGNQGPVPSSWGRNPVAGPAAGYPQNNPSSNYPASNNPGPNYPSNGAFNPSTPTTAGNGWDPYTPRNPAASAIAPGVTSPWRGGGFRDTRWPF